MDAIRLIDPAFWADPRPLALGDGKVTAWCQAEPALDNHVLFRTSGSTGAPKWIALSKQALLLSAATVNHHLGVTPDSCWGLSLPIHHVGGFGVAARSYEAACRMARDPGKWNAAAFTAWLGRERVTHVSLVPTQVHDLVAGGWRAPSPLVAIVVGGGRLEQPLGQAARDLGWPVLASYGMTETGSQIATQSAASLRFPYAPSPLPLLDPWLAKTDDDQRLQLKSPVLFSGTVEEKGGQFSWVPRVGEWFATGDRAELSGRDLTPLGRIDQVVKIFGELVDPEVVEREVIALSNGLLAPGDIAVVAVADARAGHRLVPVVEAGKYDGLEEILNRYNLAAAGFRRLSPSCAIEEMPRTELGKIRRGELAEWLLR